MERSELLVFIGDLTNDPNHDRYTAAQIYTELDNSQRKWNIGAKILKDHADIVPVAAVGQYNLFNLTGTPIAFTRATHAGLELTKVDKSWLDLYSGDDWVFHDGTPKFYFVEATEVNVQTVYVNPRPTEVDTVHDLVFEYVKDHTPMDSDDDEPFNGLPLMIPYHWGLAYDVAARLLSRDPSEVNAMKSANFQNTANIVYGDVVQVFKAFEREEPMRIRGGRIW